jgi:uncharacterized protein (DUF1800 family)
MLLSRRDILKYAAAASASLPLFGCEKLTSEATKQLGQTIPSHFAVASDANVDSDFHLLSRATYGIWPGDLDYLKLCGKEKWLDEQLHPEKIDDTACEYRARRFETLLLDPGTCYEYKKNVLRDELVRHMLLRATYSKRQLYEVMVGFFSDHLNIDVNKGDAIYAKALDDRTVVRKHALGKFHHLLAASARSAAMLIYLDGKENRRTTPSSIPNENYARELLELHTMGIDGGYSQKDVFEVARCLTGWRIHSPWQRGKVFFDAHNHDDGAKVVLGTIVPAGGGEKDVDRVLDILCHHPSTARHLSTKLAHHFVSEDVSHTLVSNLAAVYKKSDGDIRAILSALFLSSQFDESRGNKIKRPFHFIASSLRALGADTFAHSSLTEYLDRMGHGPFQYPTPDGYPDNSEQWVATLLWRWNFALNLAANSIGEVTVDLTQLAAGAAAAAHQGAQITEITQAAQVSNLFAHFVGRRPNPDEIAALSPLASKDISAELVGLILSSPAFQRC